MRRSNFIFSLVLSLVMGRPAPSYSQHPDSITVLFAFNRFDVSQSADSTLSRYLRTIKDHFVIQKVTLSGFCDDIGAYKYNDTLSLRRAWSVRDYMIRKGLTSSLMTDITGFGKRFPINDNTTGALRSKNRRVIIVLQKRRLDPFTIETGQEAPVSPQRPVSAIIQDTATSVGTSIVLKNVNFYGGRHYPLPMSYLVLDDLLKAMKEDPNLRIRIEGHVCCIPEDVDGPDLDTRQPNLSVARARFVFDYLWHQGIDSTRMSYIGLGGSGKIYPEERDPTEQSLNRRVEIRILAK